MSQSVVSYAMDELRCPKCKIFFNQRHRRPWRMPCGEHICADCLSKVTRPFRCPYCGKRWEDMKELTREPALDDDIRRRLREEYEEYLAQIGGGGNHPPPPAPANPQ